MKPHILAVAAIAALAFSTTAPAQTGEDGDPGQSLHGVDTSESIDPAAPAATNLFYFVPASAFNRKSYTTGVTYANAGCVRMDSTSTDGGSVTTDLQLPQGASIQGVRFYYADTTASDFVRLALTTFDGLGGYTNLVMGDSPAKVGFGETYLDLDPVAVVDNMSRSYALQAYRYASSSDVKFCGARVFYTIP